ncbi:MAG: hypothetical protein NTV49_05875 [Kiritimatiellaeota bacterium]|nr:hypothetical protein [Kiritimatiellota bacterium]
MENQGLKGPGITIQLVRLLRAHLEMGNVQGKREYNLRLVSLQRSESADGTVLDLIVGFDVMFGFEKPLFFFVCDFIARYERKNEQSMPWKDFSSAMALAHIIPYLREFVSNMTNRLPAPVLMLDPINAFALIEDFEQRKKQAAQAAPATPAAPATRAPAESA